MAQNVTVSLFYTVLSISEQNQLALIGIGADIAILCVMVVVFRKRLKQKFERQLLQYRTAWSG